MMATTTKTCMGMRAKKAGFDTFDKDFINSVNAKTRTKTVAAFCYDQQRKCLFKMNLLNPKMTLLKWLVGLTLSET